MSAIFNPEFKFDLDWRGHKLRVGSVLSSHRGLVAGSLKNMSAESIRHRFMGSKKEFSEKELSYLTEVDGINHYAIGIEERESEKRGVGIVRMVRSSTDSEEAEVAISLIDDYQKRGLGTLLMKLIVLALAERGIKRISYTYMPQNDGIIRLIHKLGSTRPGAHQMDWVQTFQELSAIDLVAIRQELKKITNANLCSGKSV